MKNAIIMAGGKGTRMKSVQPKVLHKVLDEPMAGLVIHALKEAGAERIVTVVGYRHEEVEAALKGQCEFAVQEPQLGTGHAVMQARQLEHETGITVVASGDCPCVRSETYAMMYASLKDADMCVLTAVPDDNGAYGRVIRKADGTVEKIVEYKDASDAERAVREINTGIYAFRTEALFEGLKHLNNDNAQHEYYLTDLVEILQKLNRKVIAVKCEDWQEVEGVNDNAALAEASQYLSQRINEAWMKNGVTMIDPRFTYIGPYVTIGHDVTIYPNTYLYGHTAVEDGAVVMPGTFVRNGRITK
jgi:bifunctional UDP-N-acetylglucosamine pyrophosphorylase/glucosamine-1-phosphate N-acetyltransferase